ncbi:E3 ubiquitin/ISG15 ligase TRIM25-like [Tachysurus vachellii]|uniref:E3 ubiquitin/ISG15 ligase TRIM25-like n=1 Tax=Tachysurus vachellii TaxID=175792 RepID=UPI00296AD070|nr:E3 ubiquitin/ISG15 ligase TRIM25-like [Tachysurus vachellii]
MAESLSQTKGRRRKSSMDEPNSFSHDSSSVLSEDLLRCSICLDVFTDPVSTPCGHNFCKSCLTHCWYKSQHCLCPLCKQKLTKRPELKINTTLREVADHFKKKSGSDKPEVLCDSCNGKKLKALKSCLDCGLSFCKIHLEPHNRVPRLKKHKLKNPVENLEDCICQNLTKTLKVKETVSTELQRIQQYAESGKPPHVHTNDRESFM